MGNSDQTCPVCNQNKLDYYKKDTERYGVLIITCRVCGAYEVAEHDYDPNEFQETHHLITGYIKEHYENKVWEGKELLSIDNDRAKNIVEQAVNYGVKEKSDKLLLAIANRTKTPGELIHFQDDYDYPLAYAKGKKEFSYYRNHLVELGLIKGKSAIPNPVQITPKGWEYIDLIRYQGPDSKNCFVAMSFNPAFDFLYEAIQEGVDRANMGYAAARLDDPPGQDIIDNELIAKMRGSRFMVADLSGNNHGVYFEAGYMKALKCPVIFTCRKRNDDGTLVDRPGEKLHFDVEHQPVIFWEEDKIEEFKKHLKNTIIAWAI